ncbi:MAG: 2-phosphosulfolactate phosphatase [Micrococcales bacterium]|nr:2-phosphosulfolactate phosphatase [Micrococcales bacterium]
MRAWHSQDRHVVRVEWGQSGALSLCRYAAELGCAVTAVVVDVLSFTTCVSVAADTGITVLPYRWRDEGAETFAHAQDATLARARRVAVVEGGVSLSPGSIRAAEGVRRLVLPSPNGSTISTLLAETGARVVAASLRNRAAVGRWLADQLTVTESIAAGSSEPSETAGSSEPSETAEPSEPSETAGTAETAGSSESSEPAQSLRAAGDARAGDHPGPVLLVVPAGERWPDGSLRPAIEDLWGAGGVIAELADTLGHHAGPPLVSPEAQAALAAYRDVGDRLTEALAECSSGRELIAQGYADDVSIAAELDASSQAPILTAGAFLPQTHRELGMSHRL